MAIAARPSVPGEVFESAHGTGPAEDFDKGPGIIGDHAGIRSVRPPIAADDRIFRIMDIRDRRQIHVEAGRFELGRTETLQGPRLIDIALFGDMHRTRQMRIAQIAGQALHKPAFLIDRHPGIRRH